jgi:Zn-dependent protease
LDSSFLLRGVTVLVPLLLSLTVHEFAHAWAAYRLGDDTAQRAGRLSLNPLVHADLLGTIILPLLGVPFGWAKPVPVNPARFRRDVKMGTGMMITASAGPISNLVLAVLCTVAFALLYRLAPATLTTETGISALLVMTIRINISLALFNLIPIPPLDGSRIVDGLLPLRLRPQWEAFSRLAPFLLLGIVFFGGRLIAGPSEAVLRLLDRIFVALT